MKTGRNDLCPCGSGKKYKKCCLEKNEQEQMIGTTTKYPYSSSCKEETDEWEPETFKNNLLEDDGFKDIFDKDADELEAEELPKISEEEEKLVDIWWEEYKNMPQNTVKEREHLTKFIAQYPHLTDHLELYHEVLFELGADHFREGIYETFVELLLQIREKFPITYKQSFDYYDKDLIFWYVAQGKLDEINNFFSLFREYACVSFSNLEEVISFFRAINHPEILMAAFVGSRQQNIIRKTIINNVIARYLDKPITNETVLMMTNDILQEANFLSFGKEELEYQKKQLLQYLRPFTVWDTILPLKRSEALDYYLKITNNFAYFLYKKNGLSFDTAEYYSNTVYQFYHQIVSDKKRYTDTFCLDESTFCNFSFIKKGMWFDSRIDCIVQMNAFYYFAEYLKMCGNILEEQQIDFQKFLMKTYQNYYSKIKGEGPEMLSFKQFPLFGNS